MALQGLELRLRPNSTLAWTASRGAAARLKYDRWLIGDAVLVPGEYRHNHGEPAEAGNLDLPFPKLFAGSHPKVHCERRQIFP